MHAGNPLPLINYKTRRYNTMNYDILLLLLPWALVFWIMFNDLKGET